VADSDNPSALGADATFTLFSASLLSKWGFEDGDMPDSVRDAIEAAGLRYEDVDWHAVLAKLVRAHLLPALDQRVEAIDIETNHNPIRASTVDGAVVEACWYGDRPNPELTPEWVDVPMAEVVRLCHDFRAGDAPGNA
jgi:hypothetical protein